MIILYWLPMTKIWIVLFWNRCKIWCQLKIKYSWRNSKRFVLFCYHFMLEKSYQIWKYVLLRQRKGWCQGNDQLFFKNVKYMSDVRNGNFVNQQNAAAGHSVSMSTWKPVYRLNWNQIDVPIIVWSIWCTLQYVTTSSDHLRDQMQTVG